MRSRNPSSTDITQFKLSMTEGIQHGKRIPFLSARSIFSRLSTSNYNHTYYNIFPKAKWKPVGEHEDPAYQTAVYNWLPLHSAFLSIYRFHHNKYPDQKKKPIANANGGLLISRQLSCQCTPSGKDLNIRSLTMRKPWFGAGV